MSQIACAHLVHQCPRGAPVLAGSDYHDCQAIWDVCWNVALVVLSLHMCFTDVMNSFPTQKKNYTCIYIYMGCLLEYIYIFAEVFAEVFAGTNKRCRRMIAWATWFSQRGMLHVPGPQMLMIGASYVRLTVACSNCRPAFHGLQIPV